MGNLIMIATILLPVGWLTADIWGSPLARRCFGVIALLVLPTVAFLFGSMIEHFNSTAEFSFASKDLLECSLQQMQAGRNDVVQREWKRMIEEYQPSYENRGRYREVVEEAIERMKQP
jgi:hypothetical protein